MVEHEIIDSFRNGLMWVGLFALAALTAVCIGAWLRRSAHIMAAKMRRSRKWIDGLVCAFLFAACVVIAGTKTNSPPLGIMMPLLPPLPQSAVQVVTEDEIAQGWRVVAETNCDAAVYAMPEGVLPSFNWHRRGTFGEWARLDLGDFAFPLGTNDETFSSFSVFNDGRIRPTPRDTAREICAVGAPMLAMQGASRFWVADAARPEAAPYQSKLLTWENFFLNADTNTPVNAQIELFTNGDFITRSNALERIYRRVAYFDWDGDGLENTVDPEPLVAGADAHGTNAEWYNVICSNVLEAVDGDGGGASGTPSPTLSWLDGVNSNAYYFVDVVTTNGPVPIYFSGDRESRLGNPVVVARAFETNHVPLLIGVDYAVTSLVPFSVSYPVDYMYLEVETNTHCCARIRWPLEFSVLQYGVGGYTTEVFPYDPGCTFLWGNDGSSGGLRSGTSSCTYSTSGGWICFSCGNNGDCGCHGCSVTGCAMLEQAYFALPSVWCGCWYEDSVPDPSSSTNNPSGLLGQPSITLTLDESAVLFESAYTNAPGNSVERHSTQVELTVEYSNPTESSLTVTLSVMSGQDRILMRNPSSGASVSGWTCSCPPKTTGTHSFSIEGMKGSERQGDVRLCGTIGTGSAIAQLTVIEVALTPEVGTGDDLLHRHQFGVCEKVWCEAYPTGMGVSWRCDGNGSITSSGAHYRHQVPFDARNYVLTAEIGDVAIPLTVQSLFPTDLLVINDSNRSIVVLTNSISAGEAGCVGIYLPLCCSPTNVSFANIELREFETPATLFTQYFATTNWIGLRDHQGSAISADWFTPGAGNYFADDVAYLDYCAEPWLGGGNLEWHIPDACRPLDPSMSSTNVFQTTEQTFSLTADGTARVMKLGYMVERMKR